ncbi:MAG: molybdenum-dependent transcriptional regulator [Rhodovulum sulfidophilum]|uniref:Molybdenum-dependent transcriptional regulator n=1 Tax=Rhodovulum sulfidophilum TaxID=35806 RepID=A0A2W5Q1W9_RHOSU|nr:MAG: molybdenum-dependent transcriptional regulator [Rhodovulum sulfidophilum]
MSIQAEISLTGAQGATLGAQRVALLEAIGREGSISGAARAIGVSYRAAWDAIRAMNNLVGHPLVAGEIGGKGGGGASLTPEGIALVESFRRLQAEMARAFKDIAPALAGVDPAARLMFGGFLRTSARNALRGVVASIVAGPVNAELRLEIAPERVLVTQLTSTSVRDLGLFPGRPAIALIKAPLIRLAGAQEPAARPNRIEGVVARVDRDDEATETLLDIGAGKTLCVIRPAAEPAPEPGARAVALVDPAHIILAVE